MEYAYYAKLIKDGFHTHVLWIWNPEQLRYRMYHLNFGTLRHMRLHICMQEQSRMKKNGMTHTGRYKNSWNQILYNARPSTSGGMMENIGIRR